MKFLVTVLVFTFAQSVYSFVPRIVAVSRVSYSSTGLFAIRCEQKYYQLEEREDRDSCTTELFLTEDRRVEFGDTDGPNYVAAVGTWEVPYGTNDFSMKITRTYRTGQDNTEMGEYTYDITRTFTGEMTKVGDSVAITGVMCAIDDVLGNKEIGYFNMIDATDERVGDDKKV